VTDAEEIARWLIDPANRHRARDFPAGQLDVDQPGLYAWFSDADTREMLADALGGVFGELIYAGQAGASAKRSGTERVATLRSRIGGNHLRGNIDSSTFRKTLTAVLFERLGLRLSGPGKLDRASTQLVSEWMQAHLSLATVACPDRATLAALEEDVLQVLDPPLNLMGMRPTPARTRLKKLRHALEAHEPENQAAGLEAFESVPGGSESQLDLLLAEEFAVNPAMARWLFDLDAHIEVSPLGVAINVWDGGEDGCGSLNAGENDLQVHLRIDGFEQAFLIENKVWAAFQPEQARRYGARADFHAARAVLVTPRSRLGDETHRQYFDVVCAIEDIADELGRQAAEADGELGRRMRWKAARLRGLATRIAPVMRPDHSPTVAFTAFCVEWLRQHDDTIVANAKSLRTAGNGWLWFAIPKGLAYKCVHGRVDLYVTSHGFPGTRDDLEAEVARAGALRGFTAAADTKGNTVLRWQGARVNPAEGVPADVAPVTDALERCMLASSWLSQQPWARP
jgi:hypothetical protein